MRMWFEPNKADIGFNYTSRKEAQKSQIKWFPTNKGGSYRKWYGNLELVVDWQDDGVRIRNFKDANGKLRSRPQNLKECFSDGITWTVICNHSSFRYSPIGMLYNNKGPILGFKNNERNYFILGFLNSKVAEYILQILSPTLGFESGYISNLPYINRIDHIPIISNLVKSCIFLSKQDWDSFEFSWMFKKDPVVSTINGIYSDVNNNIPINLEKCFSCWAEKCNQSFKKMKHNEESLNRFFIDIYKLQNELSPEVEDKDITIHYIVDTKEDAPEGLQKSSYLLTKQDVIKSLISYAVGCIFGRYSLDEEGLIYAGGDWDPSRYQKFPADQDNILPICDEEYFEDDIVGLFIKFIETVYGEETLEENLSFIADALGGKGTSREVIRKYFLNDFYKDHCKTYKKRPIYWLFDSGKKNGFKALVYMHRYQPDTIARMRTDYVHEQQSRYRTAIIDLENRLNDTSTSERVRLNKQLIKLKVQSDEIRIYEEKIHHIADQMIEIDLDDGVKHNYALFQDVLAKIK